MLGSDGTTDYYTTVYYSNAAQPVAAAPIPVFAGEEQRGIDFILHSTPVGFIRGRIVKPTPDISCNVLLSDSDSDSSGFFVGGNFVRNGFMSSDNVPGTITTDFFHLSGSQKTRGEGEFEFPRVPVGSHTVFAACSDGEQQYRAKVPIQVVSPGLDDLIVHPVPPATVSGTVVIEGESKGQPPDVRVFLLGEVVGEMRQGGPVEEDGTFELQGVPAGLYHVQVTAPPDVYLKSGRQPGHPRIRN